MRAPHAVIALLFCACAQATPAGPGPGESTPDSGTVGSDRPDAASSAPDASETSPDADIVTVSGPLINEFVADHIGSDTNEFVEIFGDPGTDYSDHAILVVEGDSNAGTGVIDAVLAVGTTDGSGVFTTSFSSNLIENGTVTLLLVAGFSGLPGQDIDTDDDGQIDNEPWSAIDDAVAIPDGDAGDLTYAGAVVLASDFDGGALQVGGASRIPDGTNSDAVTDWRRNDFDGAGLSCCASAVAEAGEALNTPGAANSMAP